MPGAWDGFELAVRAVLGQQITVVAARGLAGKLVAPTASRLRDRGRAGLTHVFPAPGALAAADLATLGMPRSRAAALSARRRKPRSPIRDSSTPRGDLEEAVERLRAIRGVGEWTAQYIALRQLREPDAFPASDIGLMRAIAKHEGRGYSAAELLGRAEPWRPWRAYAAQHLWSAA